MILMSVSFLLLTQIVFIFTEDETYFRNDYFYLDETDSFYKIYTLPRTRYRAKVLCELDGSTFFYPEDGAEVMAVTELWKETQPSINWVIVDMDKSNLTNTGGSPKAGLYAYWQIGEPNNAGGNEHCITLSVKRTLNDVNCDGKYPFICKRANSTLIWDQNCYNFYSGYKYDKIRKKCYKFHSTPRNWTDAHAICYGEQTSLAVVDNKSEADFLVKLTSNSRQENASTIETVEGIHLGFFNRHGWHTIKGVPLHLSGYKQWAQSQPDGGISEDCGAMSSNGLLYDIACNKEMFFICEQDNKNDIFWNYSGK